VIQLIKKNDEKLLNQNEKPDGSLPCERNDDEFPHPKYEADASINQQEQ